MSERTMLGLGLMATALVLGMLGDALLRTTPFGLNLGLWVAFLVATLFIVARWRSIPLTGGGRWLLLPAVGFALGFAWRDSSGLALANFAALLACLGLAASHSRAGRIVVAGLGEYVEAGFRVLASVLIGFLWICVDDVKWGEFPGGRWVRQGGAALRGVAIALPMALIFGGLFASADAVFSEIVADLIRWDISELVAHIFWIGFWACIAGGIAREALLGLPEAREARRALQRPASLSLGIVEMVTILGTLDALFLAFVLVQLRYFFGGPALVEASVNLTYAEYARRGFFELVAVAALALPLLLAADWLLRREKPAHDRLFRLLAGMLVAMLFVVMASALQRMRLYQEEFGLTELRLYTTSFMGWLAVVFAWFLATVLRGRRERFVFGAMVSGFTLVAALNAFNPDAFIVSTNVDRALAGKRFDAAYVASLSADAVPEIVGALPELPEQDRREVARRMLDRWLRPPSPDLRTWNWSRAVAWQAASADEETLRKMDEPGSR